jgi:hypothetical protein
LRPTENLVQISPEFPTEKVNGGSWGGEFSGRMETAARKWTEGERGNGVWVRGDRMWGGGTRERFIGAQLKAPIRKRKKQVAYFQ